MEPLQPETACFKDSIRKKRKREYRYLPFQKQKINLRNFRVKIVQICFKEGNSTVIVLYHYHSCGQVEEIQVVDISREYFFIRCISKMHVHDMNSLNKKL